jgi:FkbM family methyltransferase
MKYSLVVIGAHDGSKTKKLVAEAIKAGKVLMVEPVPWLNKRLRSRYKKVPNVRIDESAINDSDGEVTFYAPKFSASNIKDFGDKIGSLNPDHATNHSKNFASHIEEITVKGKSLKNLFDEFDVTAIDSLLTDAEGYGRHNTSNVPI